MTTETKSVETLRLERMPSCCAPSFYNYLCHIIIIIIFIIITIIINVIIIIITIIIIINTIRPSPETSRNLEALEYLS